MVIFFSSKENLMSFVFDSKLGLDLVPRLDGDIVDADNLSIVELYNVVSVTIIASFSL